MTEAKKKATPSMAKLTVTLFAITAVVALLLGLVDFITRDRIAEILAEKTAAAMAEVMDADEYISVEFSGDSLVRNVYRAENGGEAIGYVIEVTPSGFGGEIDMVVGIDSSGSVTGVAIIDMSETSGLGANASKESFRTQYLDASYPYAVSKDGGEIDALTGATVTSRAVTRGVNLACETVAALMETA